MSSRSTDLETQGRKPCGPREVLRGHPGTHLPPTGPADQVYGVGPAGGVCPGTTEGLSHKGRHFSHLFADGVSRTIIYSALCLSRLLSRTVYLSGHTNDGSHYMTYYG